MSDLTILNNRRARFHRLRDAKLFNGWARDCTRNRLIFESTTGGVLDPGDVVQVTIFTNQRSASFQATCTALSGAVNTLTITSGISWANSTEDMRTRVSGQTAIIEFEGGRFEVTVADVSNHGIGMHSQIEIPAGSKLCIKIPTRMGPVDCAGTVRYCRNEGNIFRIGVLLDSMSRLNSARWTSLVEDQAA